MIDHQPDPTYFDVMAAHARSHWWYEGRRRLVAEVLAGRLPRGATVLDVGCGTGDNLATLEALTGGGPVNGFELSAYAIRHAPVGPVGARVSVARAEALPCRSGSADLVACMDVLEHLDDDAVALEELRRVLRPGGLLLLTVPAYQWLWGSHDVAAAHRRRYSRPSVLRVTEAAGFTTERCTYFNSFLVPPAAALRRTPLRRLSAGADDEVGASAPVVAKAMSAFSRAERSVIRRGSRIPFGLSVLVLARR